MRRVFLLAACALLILSSCGVAPDELITVNLEFKHLDEHKVSRQTEASLWKVSEVTAGGVAFEVFCLQVGTRKYVCDDLMNIYNPETKKNVVLSDSARVVLQDMWAEIRSFVCAEAVPWSEAQGLIKRMDIAEVLDIETGRSFKVQRRGGTYHADVQPLTRSDTATLKEIYRGVWSWDRRAVIVRANGRKVAASMNGMPHGKGALNNNFPGHFCIHFWGSITHGSRTKDLGHHLMISKASGEIWGVARAATPEQQVRNLAAALNQKDWWLAQLFMLPVSVEELEHIMGNVDTIELDRTVLVSPASDTCEVNVKGELIYRGGSRYKLESVVTLRLYEGVWKVDPLSLKNVL